MFIKGLKIYFHGLGGSIETKAISASNKVEVKVEAELGNSTNLF